jgi:trehalose synthase
MAQTQTQTVPHVAPSVTKLEDYIGVLGKAEIAELRLLASRLGKRSVQMVNSTAVGGGVAEMLNRIVPLMQELDLGVRWDVITGGEDFFAVTKAFHNALHGGSYDLPEESFQTFLAYTEQNRARLQFDSEFVVIHDPQPVALVAGRDQGNSRWIWRCHIDLSRPNKRVWDFIAPYVSKYDCAIFSSPDFSRGLPVPQYLFYPSIDPLADKNRKLEPDFVKEVMNRFQIDTERPILTQISRFDRLKDPVGVVRAYQIVKRYVDCQLVLAGGTASDDPEGEAVLGEAKEAAGSDPDIHILSLPPWSALEVNAIQEASTIIVQKSLREGFGLTVTEGLWKRKPVVASAVGGIPVQVIHRQTGMLAHSVEGTAYQIRYLLANPAVAEKLGEQGHAHVRENFLVTSSLRRTLTLLLHFVH